MATIDTLGKTSETIQISGTSTEITNVDYIQNISNVDMLVSEGVDFSQTNVGFILKQYDVYISGVNTAGVNTVFIKTINKPTYPVYVQIKGVL